MKDVRPVPRPGPASVDAAVLAGGLGTRLRATLGSVPKVLAPVAGRPFLSHVIQPLSALAVRIVILCTGYRGDEVADALGARCHDLPLRYSREDSPLDTGGALRHALDVIQSETVVVLNGDTILRLDLPEMVAAHRRTCAIATVAVTWVDDCARFGRIEVGPDDSVSLFLEKGAPGPGWINGGVYVLQRAFIERIPAGRRVSLERELFPSSEGLRAYRTRAPFIDIGVPEDLARADAFLRTGQPREP